MWDAIDSSNGFYRSEVDPKCRSRVSMPFRVREGEEALETKFVQAGAAKGLLQLANVSGGLRVSSYAGMPVEGVEALAAFMKQFKDENDK